MSRPLSSPTFTGLTLLLLLASAPARADESTAAAPSEATASERQPPADNAASARLAGTAAREPDAPSRPGKRWTTGAEVDSSSYRMSLSRGKLDLGMGFDAQSGLAGTPARSADPVRPIVPTLPSLSIGLRSVVAGATPNSLAARAGIEDASPPSSSTQRLGLEWKPAQSSVFVRGGVRLTGDDRVTMKVRSGRVGLFMKSSF